MAFNTFSYRQALGPLFVDGPEPLIAFINRVGLSLANELLRDGYMTIVAPDYAASLTSLGAELMLSSRQERK